MKSVNVPYFCCKCITFFLLIHFRSPSPERTSHKSKRDRSPIEKPSQKHKSSYSDSDREKYKKPLKKELDKVKHDEKSKHGKSRHTEKREHRHKEQKHDKSGGSHHEKSKDNTKYGSNERISKRGNDTKKDFENITIKQERTSCEREEKRSRHSDARDRNEKTTHDQPRTEMDRNYTGRNRNRNDNKDRDTNRNDNDRRNNQREWDRGKKEPEDFEHLR